MTVNATVIKSVSRQVIDEAERLARAKGRPVPLSAIFSQIENKGIKVGGVRPLSTLSAYLSQSERLKLIRRGWWWLKGVQIPKHGHKMGDDDEKLPFSA